MLMKLRYLFILLLPALFMSCSKDLKHTNSIHGTWEIARIEQFSANGAITFATVPTGIMQFDKCQVNQNYTRAFRQQYSYSTGTETVAFNETGTYTFDNDGQLLVVTIPNDNGHTEMFYHLTSFQNKKLVMEKQNGDGGKMVYSLIRK